MAQLRSAIVLIAGVMFNWYSGFLVGGAIILCNAIFAYALGSKQVPVLAGMAVLVVLNFLNYGKAEMREGQRATILQLPASERPHHPKEQTTVVETRTSIPV